MRMKKQQSEIRHRRLRSMRIRRRVRGILAGLFLLLLIAAGADLLLWNRLPISWREQITGALPGIASVQQLLLPQGARSKSFREDEHSIPLCIADPGAIPEYSGEAYPREPYAGEPYSGQADSGKLYEVLHDNAPDFTQYDLTHVQGENYALLDALGRCGPAMALLDRSMMPEAQRGEIGDVRPSGWHTAKYPELIEDNFLYNRCHLIAYAMTGQNANPQNLITGTRAMNVDGMLPFEVQVLEYLDAHDGHVLYRVTPFFKGDELVARGVEMEAWSVEDEGSGVCFHVFVYNVQPGIEIDYRTGDSWQRG